MFNKNNLKLVCCPICKSELKQNNNYLLCNRCVEKYCIQDETLKMTTHVDREIKLSIIKWEEFYRKQIKFQTYYKEYENYINLYYQDIYRQLNEVKKIRNIVYLEIGCGAFFFGQAIAKNCKLIIGVDISPTALKIAKKMLDEKGIKNYLLIQGDILHMPLKDNVVDLIYGGGVIEHFEDTQTCITELYRVLNPGGASFNTVPYLNLGSLTYRQLWGNIPNVPIVKQVFTFFHTKILGGKHMIFGYEMSFLGSTLKKIHKKAGFEKVKVEKFDVTLHFEFIPQLIRKPFIWLASNSGLFWPMVKVIAIK